jgi:hypothetical protein
MQRFSNFLHKHYIYINIYAMHDYIHIATMAEPGGPSKNHGQQRRVYTLIVIDGSSCRNVLLMLHIAICMHLYWTWRSYVYRRDEAEDRR